jgi:hypothetical protein
MTKISTLICITDNQKHSSAQIVDFENLIDNIDNSLDALFAGFELKAPEFSLSKTEYSKKLS